MIPLALRSYERTAALQPEVVLKNMFIEKDESENSDTQVIRIQRPGLTPHVTLAGRARGLFFSENALDNRVYAAVGGQLVALNGVGSTVIGPIANDDLAVTFAPSFFQTGIASAGNFYVLDQRTPTPALTQVAMPDGRVAIDVTDLNNYIIIACPDGRFYWLVPGQTTIDPLNFATAESSPDGLIAIKRIGDEVYFFGESSVEVWSSTGDSALPFIRSSGRNFSRGILDRDTIQIVDNTIFWVGENGTVYRAANVPNRISNHGIEERIRRRTAPLSTLTLTVDAHEFYVLKIPGQGTFAYDASTQAWCEFGTFNETVWRPQHSVFTGDDFLLSDQNTGKIWRLDYNNNTDDGIPIERVISGTVRLPATPTRNDNFHADVASSIPTSIRIRWRNAAEDFGPYSVMRARAGNDRVSIFRLGRAIGQFRTFELSCIENSRIQIGDCWANETDERSR